jgi:hypothetical protein
MRVAVQCRAFSLVLCQPVVSLMSFSNNPARFFEPPSYIRRNLTEETTLRSRLLRNTRQNIRIVSTTVVLDSIPKSAPGRNRKVPWIDEIFPVSGAAALCLPQLLPRGSQQYIGEQNERWIVALKHAFPRLMGRLTPDLHLEVGYV